MRYVRKVMVEKIVNDEELKEASVILDLLDGIRKQRLDISISYTKGGGLTPQTFSHPCARVEKVDREKGTVDILCLSGKGSAYTLKVTALPIGSIVRMEMIVNNAEQFAKRDGVTRMDMLDLTPEEINESTNVKPSTTPRQLSD